VPWRFSDAGRLTAWIDRHPGDRKPAQKLTLQLTEKRAPAR
jgi:hypothetical protein